jgi:biopolymer transport protein ExbD
MKRRASIDLTPMLDIILLLVFGFMFIVAMTKTELSDKQTELEQKEKQLLSQVETTTKTVNSQKDTIDAYEIKINSLESEIDNKQKQIDQIKSATREYFLLNEQEIQKIVDASGKNPAIKVLDSYGDVNETANSIVMYELLSKEFFFVDIIIRSDSNRIYINDQITPVAIDVTDVDSIDKKNQKIQDIKKQISKVLDGRVGGSSMAFVTLSTDNEAIMHYAWQTTWDAVKQLEEKYGAKNYFSAELFLTSE